MSGKSLIKKLYWFNIIIISDRAALVLEKVNKARPGRRVEWMA